MRLTLRKMIELKNTTFLSVFVSDQTPVAGETQYFIPFLNQPTAVFLGIEKIAKATNYPVVYCHINRIKRGYYEATFKTLSANPKTTAEHEITALHIRELERIIQQRPELWLWSHKRWKFRPEDLKQ
jgi:KDO2-lipid IV(A) lauroyltransferase